MVSLPTVRASNSKLRELGPGLVAVFVGGTSGIGESTAREFVRYADKPRIYLVGRSDASASRIMNELRTINPDGKIQFIKSDVSLLRDVDKACEELKVKEEKINLLFMTAGILTSKGRDETREGLDKKFSLHYYARMRFISNLLPQLHLAALASPLSRVVSVLAAGTEGKLYLDDLSLKTHYSLSNCATHACTMNSLAAETLAAANPSTSFIHAYPGIVKTGLLRDHGALVKVALDVSMFLAKPWVVDIRESGERHLYAATSTSYPSADKKDESAAMGSAGVTGSGAYLLNWNGEPCGKDKVMNEHRAQGTGKQVWTHTLEVFGKICGTTTGRC